MAERIRKLTNSEVEVLARIIADTMCCPVSKM